MPLVKVIIGSTRPGRFGQQPAAWLVELSKEHPEATYELVDLADFDLPLLDEPVPPSMVTNGEYANEHTKKWADIIGPADGFVFITAEYNYSIPAALKNAIDFLGAEWRYKPVAFVSYGVGGGIRAVTALRVSVAQLSMYSLRDEINFVNYWAQLDESGTLQPTEAQTADAHKLLKNVAFWANTMAAARKELSATAAAK
jgi:NAD(P)H-dependent FMN reductase